jgi:hypothetical protein
MGHKAPMHFNKIKKQDAWQELGKEMNRPVDECKKKMDNLLSSLRREKMKMRKSRGTGKGECSESWVHTCNVHPFRNALS